MRALRNPNPAIAAVVALVAGAAFAGTYFFDEVPPGLPGLGAVEFPRLVCVVMLALAALLALKQASPPDEEEVPRIGGTAWLIFAACLLFLPAMEVLGLFATIPLFLVATGRLWGETDWKLLIGSALGLTTALWLVFVKVFQLTLPAGWLGASLGI